MTDDGVAWSWGGEWGGESSGRLGQGHFSNTDTPTVTRPQQVEEVRLAADPPDSVGRLVAAAASSAHSLVLSEGGTVFACGSSNFLGMGGGDNRYELHEIAALRHVRVVALTVGSEHSAVVTEEGHVYSWGGEDGGRLGYRLDNPPGTPFDQRQHWQLTPRRIDALSHMRVWALSTNAEAACFTLALCEGGAVYSWGHRWGGKLGNGDGGPSGFGGEVDEVLEPQRIMQGKFVREVCASGYKGFAVARSGNVFGWGIADGDDALLHATHCRHQRYPGPSGPRDRIKVYTATPTAGYRAIVNANGPAHNPPKLRVRSHPYVLNVV